jgi:acetyltransferase-like isoleucine patch superfamily enzyme
MSRFHRFVTTSNHPLARFGRRMYRGIKGLSVPAPRLVAKPLLWGFLTMRFVYYFLMRTFVCEPLFKAYCKQYGRHLHTGVYVHWVMGKGDLILGDHVRIDGKCSFLFSSRYTECPTLEIGDHTYVGHNCSFTVGKRISIGRHCLIAGGTIMFDSNGHPTDPAARLAHLPPKPEEVRPIEIGDNVWIGMNAMIHPGVKIGEGSVVSANSVVRTAVLPYTIVAGNPARKVADLASPASTVAAAEDGQPVENDRPSKEKEGKRPRRESTEPPSAE